MLQTFKQRLKNKKGFTLIELIVVIAIIGILAAVLVPRFTGFTETARQRAATSDANNILLAVNTLIAEGDTSITTNEINTRMGSTLVGTVTPDPITANTFTYTSTRGTATYVVVVTNGIVDTDFLAAGAGVTGSTSTGM